jgi:hypothetical protein
VVVVGGTVVVVLVPVLPGTVVLVPVLPGTVVLVVDVLVVDVLVEVVVEVFVVCAPATAGNANESPATAAATVHQRRATDDLGAITTEER